MSLAEMWNVAAAGPDEYTFKYTFQVDNGTVVYSPPEVKARIEEEMDIGLLSGDLISACSRLLLLSLVKEVPLRSNVP